MRYTKEQFFKSIGMEIGWYDRLFDAIKTKRDFVKSGSNKKDYKIKRIDSQWVILYKK